MKLEDGNYYATIKGDYEPKDRILRVAGGLFFDPFSVIAQPVYLVSCDYEIHGPVPTVGELEAMQEANYARDASRLCEVVRHLLDALRTADYTPQLMDAVNKAKQITDELWGS